MIFINNDKISLEIYEDFDHNLCGILDTLNHPTKQQFLTI